LLIFLEICETFLVERDDLQQKNEHPKRRRSLLGSAWHVCRTARRRAALRQTSPKRHRRRAPPRQSSAKALK
jgi:hypothetical protein